MDKLETRDLQEMMDMHYPSSLQEPTEPSACFNYISVPPVIEGDRVLKLELVTRSPDHLRHLLTM